MAIGFGLELRVRVRVIVREWVRVKFRVVFCSNTAQFLTVLHILHCGDAEWVWRLGSVVRVMVSIRVYTDFILQKYPTILGILRIPHLYSAFRIIHVPSNILCPHGATICRL